AGPSVGPNRTSPRRGDGGRRTGQRAGRGLGGGVPGNTPLVPRARLPARAVGVTRLSGLVFECVGRPAHTGRRARGHGGRARDAAAVASPAPSGGSGLAQ